MSVRLRCLFCLSIFLSFLFCSYICLFRNSFLLMSLYVFRINIPLALFYLKFKISATSNLKFKIINLKVALNRKTVSCSNEECTNTRTDREKTKTKPQKMFCFCELFNLFIFKRRLTTKFICMRGIG
jgi:hypothetical protein